MALRHLRLRLSLNTVTKHIKPQLTASRMAFQSIPHMDLCNTDQGPYLLSSMLPSSEDTYFEDTAFFANGNVSLPTPADVRRAAGPKATWNRPTPIVFSALNLIVKYGPTITVTEGQCLWAIRHFLPSVPVPEVYGWCREQGRRLSTCNWSRESPWNKLGQIST